MPSLFGENVFGMNRFSLLQVTDTVIRSVVTQPPLFLTVAVYSVFCLGEATGSKQSTQLSDVGGAQLILTMSFENDGLNGMPEPAVILTSGPRSNTGNGNTEMVTESLVTKQPLESEPVTIYVVVVVGLAMGVDVLGLFNPVAGDQLYCWVPVANNCIP